jgi:hypothetical protein
MALGIRRCEPIVITVVTTVVRPVMIFCFFFYLILMKYIFVTWCLLCIRHSGLVATIP